MDFDGDELNLLANNTIIAAAQRTINNHNILPLFYDAQKAGKQLFNANNRFESLMTAHKYGGAAIGGVSNTLTKLWNSTQDRDMAARICCMNNLIIDAAKTGKIIPYPEEIAKPINQLSHSRMPWFFQFTPNGRRGSVKCCSKPQKGDRISVMDKIALLFEDLKKADIKLNYEEINNFNPYMLLSEDPKNNINRDIFTEFDYEINKAQSEMHEIKQTKMRSFEDMADRTEGHIKDAIWWNYRLDKIKNKLLEDFDNDIKTIYTTLVVIMFMDKAMSDSRKEQFWIIFGDIAYQNIKNNLSNCHICEKDDCHQVVPNWDKEHDKHHQDVDEMHKRCFECGKIYEEFKTNKKSYCPECCKRQKERDKACRQRLREKDRRDSPEHKLLKFQQEMAAKLHNES